MKQLIEKIKADVTEFRTTFGLPILKDEFMLMDDHALHHSLIIEELSELATAESDIERLDAIVDSAYVLVGQKVHDSSMVGADYFIVTLIDLAHQMGFQFELAWDEVHQSNMSKLCVDLDEARETKSYYEDEMGYEEVEIIAQENYYLVRNAQDVVLIGGKIVKAGKTLKSINYKPADLSYFVGG